MIDVLARSPERARRAPRWRAQVGALLYLKVRTTLRKWELVARDPLRRLAWAPYAFSVGWLLVARTTNLHLPLGGDVWKYATVFLPSLVFLLIAVSRAGGGRLFESRAHAHLVGGLGIPVWLLITFQRVERLPVLLFNGGLFGVLLVPAVLGVGPERIVEAVVSLLLGLTFVSGAGLVSFSIRLLWPRLGTAWTVIAIVLALVVALPAAAVVSGVSVPGLDMLGRIAAWTPGGLIASGAAGDLSSDLWLLVIAAAALALGIRMSRDLGPDLAEASYRFFTLVDSARAGRSPSMTGSNMRLRDPVQRSTSTGLRGAGVLAWKAWLEFRRSGSGRWRLLTMAIQLLVGVLLGMVWLAVINADAASSLTTLFIGGVVLSMVAVGFTSGRRFGPLLRNPLFALNRDRFARRLTALLLSREAAESIGTLASWIGVALVLPAAIPMILVIVLDSRAVAVAMLGLDLFVFAWLPSATDRTMAMRIIRTAVLAFTVPVGTVFALWAVHTPAPELVLLAPLPVLLLAGWALLWAAGSRLEGNVLAVAIAERR